MHSARQPHQQPWLAKPRRVGRGVTRAVLLAALCAIGATDTGACQAARQAERNNLRSWARADTTPREERIRHLIDILKGVERGPFDPTRYARSAADGDAAPGDGNGEGVQLPEGVTSNTPPPLDPHLRATAAQMLGEMRAEALAVRDPDARFVLAESDDPIEIMLALLGGLGVADPDPSAFVRAECVMALVAYGRADLMERMRTLLYRDDRRDSEEHVRRALIQGFGSFPRAPDGWPTAESAALVTSLASMLYVAVAGTTGETRSLRNRIHAELVRLSRRRGLTEADTIEWELEAASQRERARARQYLDEEYAALIGEWVARTDGGVGGREKETIERDIAITEARYDELGIFPPDPDALIAAARAGLADAG